MNSNISVQRLIVGSSTSMQEVHRQIEQVAASNATVLLRGETGTGKELVARAIHDLSRRNRAPLVTVNCGALPENLMESELFGHERGAFTGAETRRKGRFELADRGTLFLDEIGELSLSAQVKFLRVLQERALDRLGGEAEVRVDVRVVAATHQDLEAAMAERRFRADLYYRLNVFTIAIPPLRERLSDIPDLAEHFLQRFAVEHGKECPSLSPEALALLQAYFWPGNIRELQNVMERAVLVCETASVQPCDLPLPLRTTHESAIPQSLSEASGVVEKQLIENALRAARGSKARSARLLGTTERVVSYKIRKYGINCRGFKAQA